MSAVRPSTSWLSIIALASISIFAVTCCCEKQAIASAVHPFSSRTLTDAPAARSAVTSSSWPAEEAHMSIEPLKSGSAASTSPPSRKYTPTASTSPPWAACTSFGGSLRRSKGSGPASRGPPPGCSAPPADGAWAGGTGAAGPAAGPAAGAAASAMPVEGSGGREAQVDESVDEGAESLLRALMCLHGWRCRTECCSSMQEMKMCPLSDAYSCAVMPRSSRVSVEAPAPMRRRTMSAVPTIEANISAVTPWYCCSSTSAPARSASRDTSRLPNVDESIRSVRPFGSRTSGMPPAASHLATGSHSPRSTEARRPSESPSASWAAASASASAGAAAPPAPAPTPPSSATRSAPPSPDASPSAAA